MERKKQPINITGGIKQRLKYLRVFMSNGQIARTCRRIIWCILMCRINAGHNCFKANCIMMRSRISIKGKNNKVIIAQGSLLDGIKILVLGDDNEIVIGEGNCFHDGTVININGARNKIVLGKNNYFNDVRISCLDNNNFICVGDDNVSTRNLSVISMEGHKITLGNNNLISYNVEIRNSDSHSVINENGERINGAKDIEVGNHVWIAQDVLILKGASLNDNCVIGAKSMVTNHSFEEGCIAAGIPARIIKSNITWDINRV